MIEKLSKVCPIVEAKCAKCHYFNAWEWNDYSCTKYEYPVKHVTYSCELYGGTACRKYKMNKNGIVIKEMKRGD